MKEAIHWPLSEGETLLWQGRPAPRCYTFRHWLQALIGSVLFLASSFWLMVGVQLIRAEGHSLWLLPVPVLLVVGAFVVGPGQLLLARIRWEKNLLRPDGSASYGAQPSVRSPDEELRNE